MAKRRMTTSGGLIGGGIVSKAADGELPGGQPAGDRTSKIEDWAEDLGRLLGTAKARAEGWIGQRQNVAKQLEQIRDTATSLLTQLGDVTARRQGRQPGSQGGRKKAQGPRATASGAYPRKKFSATTIAKMRASQKARWAKIKKDKAG